MKISIFDQFNPEETAMLHSLLSRSNKPLEQHLDDAKYKESGKFMNQWYCKAKHKSIGDTGSTSIWIEGVSMLAAKAIQDNQLYNGLERSTRYQDFSSDSYIDPFNSDRSKSIMENWMEFYQGNFTPLHDHLFQTYRTDSSNYDLNYDMKIVQRTKDVLRGFLPCGTKTSLSWHTNLRQAWDNCTRLMYHPLDEVKCVAKKILDLLKQKYPNSFNMNLNIEQDRYNTNLSIYDNYYYPDSCAERTFQNRCSQEYTVVTSFQLFDLQSMQNDRINKAKRCAGDLLPKYLKKLGLINNKFLIDFGCFRDIQRHRSLLHQVPLIEGTYSYENWYIDMFPREKQLEVSQFLKRQEDLILDLNGLDNTFLHKQYYFPLCVNVPVDISGSINAWIYFLELRSQQPVHPVLRKICQNIAYNFQKYLPEFTMYVDTNPSSFSHLT